MAMAILLLAARDMKTHVTLHDDTVVATTMSNMGLEAALNAAAFACCARRWATSMCWRRC